MQQQQTVAQELRFDASANGNDIDNRKLRGAESGDFQGTGRRAGKPLGVEP
jgi:hypothetical protein